MHNILVIGSINMDMVISTDSIPNIGETVTGHGFTTVPGGKGANQAVAVGKLGGNVKMIGCVGNDANGKILLSNLNDNHVTSDGIKTIDCSSGVAIITLCGGDNQIIIDPGANAHVNCDMIDENIHLIQWADIIICQLEIPQQTVLYAVKMAKQHNKRVVFNPAPMMPLMPDLLKYIDIIIPNQHEAGQMLGKNIHSVEEGKQAVLELMQLGIGQVIVTMGNQGAVFNEGNNVKHQEVYDTNVIDTTAAGDSFIAGVCVALSKGKTIAEAVSYATAVSAITVSRLGASSSLPTEKEVLKFLEIYF